MLYAIKINKTNRYISYCDSHWYETVKEPLHIYTHEQALDIAKQMKEHYVYCVEIISFDNKSEIIDCFHKTIKNNIANHKSLTKIRIKF